MALNPPEAAGRVRPVVLVVDDDPGLRESFRLILDDHCDVLDVSDGAGALETLRSCQVDLVLLDIRLPDIDGIELLERIKALDEEEEILALVRRALEKRTLDREVVYLRSELARQHDFEELVGRHPAMQGLYQLIASVARTPGTVLIMGESGTGKELVARAIHRQGSGRERPFVPVNLAAVSEGLLESELFGHEKGALTGAAQNRPRRIQPAPPGSPPPSASGGRTSRSWWSTSSASTITAFTSRWRACRPRPWRSFTGTRGRETCASWRTSSSARSPWPPRP